MNDGNAFANEQRQIGIVGEKFVDFDEQRAGSIALRSLCVEIDQRAIAGAGLEQKTWPAIAARFHIHDRAHTRFQFGIVQEGGCTQEAVFFSVGKNARIGWLLGTAARFQGADGFQNIATPEPSSAAPGPAGTES